MTDRIDATVLKFRAVLAETEHLVPDALRLYQENLLLPLLRHAQRNVPFYADRLRPLFRGSLINLKRWHDIPILTRAEAQENVARLTARSLPPHAGAVEAEETSGSTGRPFEHLKNELVQLAALGMTDRMYRWWDFDGDKSMATFLSRRREMAPPPNGATINAWRIGGKGPHHLLDMWADTDIQIDWLAARKPAYLTAYSSTLLPLAERTRERGVTLRFEHIVSVATAMSDEIRSACETAFDVRPIDQYGAQEIGNIAYECPRCGHYHVNAEAVLLELLTEDGRPCSPGEMGRVVVTSLYNYAMPFIRYEIGDYAVAGPYETRCEVRLPTLTRVLGRYRGTFTLPDGRIVYPYVQIGRFRDYIDFSQVQVVQTEIDRIEVRYVPRASAAADEAGLQSYLREAIHPAMNVRAVPVAEIPRAASGKFEDFLSLVPHQAIGQPRHDP